MKITLNELRNVIKKIIKEEMEDNQNIFYYIVNLDERGEYDMTIYNSSDEEVVSIDTETAHELIDDGFLKYKPHQDLDGLAKYYTMLGILPKESIIVSEDEFYDMQN